MMRSILLAALGAAALGNASAQDLPPEAARADLTALYEGLQAAHYDLYASTPKPVFDQRYDELVRRYDAPVSTERLHEDFQRFAALSGHAHARVVSPHPGWADADGNGEAIFFPLSFTIHDGDVIVTQAPVASGIEPGDRIVGLQGEPNSLWLPRLTRNISAETPQLAYSQLAGSEIYFIWLEYGTPPSFEVTVSGAAGTRTLSLAPASLDMLRTNRTEQRSFELSGREARMIDETTAYLRPGPFLNFEATSPEGYFDPAATQAFVAWVDAAFTSFIESGAEDLILDLRDNPGGDNSYSDPVIAWFADEAFRFASDFRIRVSDQTRAANQARLDARGDGEGGVSALLGELFADADTGGTVSFELPYTQPRDGARFEGAVHVLVNRYSFSNAVSVGALIQDYGFGTVLGEPTHDMATTYGAMEHFTLPESSFLVGYPKALIIRPNGEAHPHPLTPDIALRAPAIRGERDVVLEAAIALIRDE